MVFLTNLPFLFIPVAILMGILFFNAGTFTGKWPFIFTCYLGISLVIYGVAVLANASRKSLANKAGIALALIGVVLFAAGFFVPDTAEEAQKEAQRPFEAAFAGTVLSKNGQEKPNATYNGQSKLYAFDDKGHAFAFKGNGQGTAVISEKYMASKPEDVRGIVIIREGERLAGRYSPSGRKVYHVDYLVTILDLYHSTHYGYSPFQDDTGFVYNITGAEKIFPYAGHVPSNAFGDMYGYPDETALRKWVEDTWSEYLQKESLKGK